MLKPIITMQASRYARRALVAFVCWISIPAQSATTPYFNDFQGSIGSEWTTTAASGIHIASAPLADYGGTRRFLGEYGNDTLTLSLGELAPHDTATVSFSLYLIRSWDGSANTILNDPLGPDTWGLKVAGGPTLLSDTFSNGNLAGQTYGGAFSNYTHTDWTPCKAYQGYTGPGAHGPMTGANECYSLGYMFNDVPNGTNEAMDSVYELSFTFAHTGSSLMLNFGANGLQGIGDESWGLDNVKVEVSAVPIPASIWLLGSGLLGLVGIARRKARMT